MKTASFLAVLALVLCIACDKDNDNGLINENGLLHYDGDNFVAPQLGPGTYEMAMMIPGSKASAFKDQKLKEVTFYVAFKPVQCEVKIYKRGTADTPGNLIYSADVTDIIREQTWFTHRLTEDVVLDGEDVWASIAIIHNDTRQSIGCDQGPRRNNGDWFFSSEDSSWRAYFDRTGESINWNVRMKVE